jgi:beta-lactamase superfamily II metal-dependent hydrolase
MPAKKSTNAPETNLPSSVTIRMYNVGFGDCFLLTFTSPDRDRHVLIDFGSTAAPKGGGANYMMAIAKDIKAACNGKLDILVATHRHRDHISGFAIDGDGSGKVIADLKPTHVIQPWTEDPNAEVKALTATTSTDDNSEAHLTAQYLGSLEDMHSIAATVVDLVHKEKLAIGDEKKKQLTFLGENNLKNLSAVKNLMTMGSNGQAHFVNAGMKLDNLLPGVKITVLGPPTLKQSDAIRKERAKDPGEFWQFRSFWASQKMAANSLAAGHGSKSFASHKVLPRASRSPNMRWFIEQSQSIHADQALELVRDLDSVMNNTSVILLFEIGDQKLLFPGDAQIENWSFALNNPDWCDLLKDVNLYKVGHHGSLNGTPKSLWKLFDHRGPSGTQERLDTLCSTKSGKHGSAKTGTEVPRAPLVNELKTDSDFSSSEEFQAPDAQVHSYTITIGAKLYNTKRVNKRKAS